MAGNFAASLLTKTSTVINFVVCHSSDVVAKLNFVYPVGLALASNQRVIVKVLDSKSALTPGQFTGEHATIKKVRIIKSKINTHILLTMQLLSPVASHEVGTIRCIGLNFKDHAVGCKPSPL